MENNKPSNSAISCPVCTSIHSSFHRKVGETSLYYCHECLIRFSFPMQHPGQEWYEESEIYEEVRWNLPPLRKLGSRWEFKRAFKNLERQNTAILDIGCGRGDFLYLARSKGYQAFGIDLNGILIKVAKEAYHLDTVYQSSVEDFVKNQSTASFGAVTAFEVLEHLPDPHFFIRQCWKLLNKEGQILISVPGYHRFPHWVNNEVDLPPHHLILWSEHGLRSLLAASGFKEIKVERKPLLINDLMYHVVRFIPILQKPGLFFKFIRGFVKISLIPIWCLFSLSPKAGGFTYLAVGKK